MITTKREEPDRSLFAISADYKIVTVTGTHSDPADPAH
jgi:hypothetical protein